MATADDVVFSYTVLRSEAAIPTYRAYYRDIAKVEALERLTVRVICPCQPRTQNDRRATAYLA